MSAKNVDRHNRFRNITVGFRVSPEEQAELNRAVALSGLSKQEYCYRRCMERDVVVQGNPRVYQSIFGRHGHNYSDPSHITLLKKWIHSFFFPDRREPSMPGNDTNIIR